MEIKDILKASSVIFLFIFLVKIFGAFKEIVIAYKFGVGPVVDAFSFVFAIVQWPITIFTSIMTAVLIPIIHKIARETTSEKELFYKEVFALTILFSIFILIVIYFTFHFLIHYNVFQHSLFQIVFLKYLIFYIPLGFLIALFSVITMANQKHINTLLELCPSLGVILLLGCFDTYMSLVYGILVGSFIQASVLGVFLYFKKELFLPQISCTSPYWKLFFTASGIVLLGQFFMSGITLIDQYFAATLASGSLSILSYSDKILGLFLSLATIVIGRSILPIFSKIHVHNTDILKLLVLKISSGLFLVGIILSVFISLYATDIVKIIFERGAFTFMDVMKVASFLKLSSYQIPFFLSSIVLSYSIISQRRYWVIAWSGFFAFCCKLFFIVIFMNHISGLELLAYSTTFVYCFTSIYCLGAIIIKKN
ncbi:lipid II flippase MurJ [Sulfurospirillum barnesii]|uniref:lipid II flippase MurJ n=1 Tax=Sulfurospirillum barnesii TaxID=44674 RepID=UPI00155A9E46|nr:lipid II flippase MurJ [Sulfurospirillum barnesii]